jgi:hypothetical protein
MALTQAFKQTVRARARAQRDGNFFGMVSALQKKTRVKLRVTAPE